uniref:Uncharacterized protein n=1 Tax=Ditylenchus dipsaci TaxID=166011 RepID=A0A915EKN1_9BILA
MQNWSPSIRPAKKIQSVIPGGCTNFIQAPDVVWDPPIKVKIQELYNNWMLNYADKKWTANGNLPPTSMNIWL